MNSMAKILAVFMLLLLAAPSLRAENLPTAPFSSCVNLSNALEAPREGEWGYTIRHRDIALIAKAGFDAIRIPIRWSAHTGETPPYTIDPAFLSRVDEVVASVIESGLFAIINLHHFREIMEDPEGQEARLLSIWKQLSAHYASWSDQLVFEVLNEGSGNLTDADMDHLNIAALQTIRIKNPDRWVVLGTAKWGGLEGMLAGAPPKDQRLMASFHYYEPFAFTHQGAGFVDPPLPTGQKWGNAEDRKRVADHMAQAAEFGAKRGLPVFLGEFGVYREVPLETRAAWIETVRKQAEAQDIPWCHWGFAADFRSYELSQERWIVPVTSALGMPR